MPRNRLAMLLTLSTLTLLVALAIAAPREAYMSLSTVNTHNGNLYQPKASWGNDIQVNYAFTSRNSVALNHSMAVSPVNPNFVVSSFDARGDSYYYIGYARSLDSGQTWASGKFTDTWGNNLTPYGYTSVGFDGFGTAYYLALADGNNFTGYFVLTSTNGLNWSSPKAVVVTSNNESRSHGNLVVDQRTTGPYAGSLYAFYTLTNNKPPYYHGIYMRYSRNHGATWSGDIQVSDVAHGVSYYPYAKVASDGSIYVVFQSQDTAALESVPLLYMNKSTDGGQTWSSDRLVTNNPTIPIGGPDFKGHELVLAAGLEPYCTQMRINHNPSLAVSPTDPNTVYVTWNDGRWDASIQDCDIHGKHSDIAFSRSTDAGLTWSPVARINDDPQANGVDQFQPTIAVQQNGTLGITWYDRRYDPNHWLYDLTYSESADGGLTWSANERVSDHSSSPAEITDYKGVADLGYRKPFAIGPGYLLPGWIDVISGTAKGNLNVDYASSGGPTPSPTQTSNPLSTSTATIVATGTRTISPTNTASPTFSRTASSTSSSTPSPTTVSATSTVCPIKFQDVSTSNTFYPYVRCLACRNILGGYACGAPGEPCGASGNPYFRPGVEISRGQIAKIVAQAASLNDDPGTQIYEDVPTGSPFFVYIQRLSNRGYMGGYPCGQLSTETCVAPGNRPYFRPSSNATRGQLSKIVSNASQNNDTVVGQTYQDVSATSPFYLFIERLSGRSVMSGYPCGGVGEGCVAPDNRPYFRPNANVTRGQASKIVSNTFFPNCQTSYLQTH